MTKVNKYLNNSNWAIWHKRMIIILRLCKVLGYIDGTIKCPSMDKAPLSTNMWTYNNIYATSLIMHNIEPDQMIHVDECGNSHSMWNNLVAIHESHGH